ncbi:MAG: hypothetical protein AABW59_01520 [archaeon]
MNARGYFGERAMNSKGIFITLATFFMAIMLIGTAVNLQQIKGAGNATVNIAIAGERVMQIEQNALDTAREVYRGGEITWAQNDTNFTFFETFPNTSARGSISTQLSNANGFLVQEFPGTVGLNIGAVDVGRIYAHGKEMTIRHSPTTGFGTNTAIYFDSNTANVKSIRIDLNETANANNTDSTLPLCGACSNPVKLTITWNDTSGVFFSFDDYIDLSQAGSVDVRSTGNEHVIFSYNSSGWQFTTTNPLVSLSNTVEFDNALFEIGPDMNLLNIPKLGGFGFTSQ